MHWPVLKGPACRPPYEAFHAASASGMSRSGTHTFGSVGRCLPWLFRYSRPPTIVNSTSPAAVPLRKTGAPQVSAVSHSCATPYAQKPPYAGAYFHGSASKSARFAADEKRNV